MFAGKICQLRFGGCGRTDLFGVFRKLQAGAIRISEVPAGAAGCPDSQLYVLSVVHKAVVGRPAEETPAAGPVPRIYEGTMRGVHLSAGDQGAGPDQLEAVR